MLTATTASAKADGKSSTAAQEQTLSTGNTTKIPLIDMTGSQNYLGFQGGLYENGSNAVPSDHDGAGKQIAAGVQPLDSSGKPSATGTIVFASIGMSNSADEFDAFILDSLANTKINHTTLAIVNGAKSGVTACYWTAAEGSPACSRHTSNQFDRVRDDVLTPLGLTEKQVQVVWVKEANGGPGETGCGTNGDQPCKSLCAVRVKGCANTVTTTEAVRYESQLGDILRAARTRWPNLKLAFVSTRIYGGYATVDINPEPYAYEYGFSAKWLIQAQINQLRNGAVDPTAGNLDYNTGVAPWTAWASYIWANGDVANSEGLLWCNGQETAPCNEEADFQTDGTHPSLAGQQKVAGLLTSFLLSSPYTSGWFAAK